MIDLARTGRSAREYLDTLDEAAWGAASEAKPKFVSRSDPAAQWTGALKGHAFFAYATNYLIDLDHAVIVDVEAHRHARPGVVGCRRAGACHRAGVAAVVDHCRRPFARETVRETFRSPGNGGLLLGRSPVTAFASVIQGETTLTTDDFEYDAATGLLHRLAGLYRVCWSGEPVAVEYTAGFTLPADTGTWTLQCC